MNKKKLVLTLALSYGVVLGALTAWSPIETFLVQKEDQKLVEPDFDDSEDIVPVASSSEKPTSSAEKTSEKPASSSSSASSESVQSSEAVETSSSDEIISSSTVVTANTEITLTEHTWVHEEKPIPYALVRVKLKNTKAIRTRLATTDNGYVGSNVTQSFGELLSAVSDQNPLVAMDGCFPYFSNRQGYVVSNGVEYRSNKRTDAAKNDDFAIFKDGTALAYSENDYTLAELQAMHGGVWQNWCFGPALVKDGELAVIKGTEVAESNANGANQRAALGYLGPNEFLFLIANFYSPNGDRNNRNAVGLSLWRMGNILVEAGCEVAYNFDGGGSAGLYTTAYAQNGGYWLAPTRTEIGDIVYVV